MDTQVFLTLGSALKWAGIALLPLFALPLVVLALPKLADGLAKRLIAFIDALSGSALGVAMACGVALIFLQLIVVLLRYAFGLSFTCSAKRSCTPSPLCSCSARPARFATMRQSR